MKITVAQLNPTVGHIEENLEKILDYLSRFAEKSDLIIFPELFLTGYPPRDFLEKPSFIEKAQKAVNGIVTRSKDYPGVGILLGTPTVTGKDSGKGLYNSAILIQKGQILASQHKSLLPSYDVFDETRYFDPAEEVKVIPFKEEKLGISICEDMWNAPELWPEGKPYHFDPMECLATGGATLLVNLSASPFYADKESPRFSIIQNHAKKYRLPFLFVNQVGSNDELIFDGRSTCVDKKGEAMVVFPAFKEHVETIDTNIPGVQKRYLLHKKVELIHDALVLGVRDYMRKCGFTKAIIGLSGGIDSAVTSCLAKEAIGKENVLGITMPSAYSAGESEEYSRVLAKNLGIEFKVVSISETYDSYIKMLKRDLFVNSTEEVDIALQNIQARIRGNILMAFSNKFGYLVLSTGNKSELAVGYCTLYGDMAGGLAVISDVPKSMVYQLADYVNKDKEIIPRKIIERAPSAELKPDQLDQDTLPAYEILDEVLYYYLEEGCSVKKLISQGFDADTVKWIVHAVNKNEYKRRQAAPGLKVTSKAFGMGRRMPIAAEYSE